MIQDKRNKIPLHIDWDALDKSWADQYEEDYGCLVMNFNSSTNCNGLAANMKLKLQCEI